MIQGCKKDLLTPECDGTMPTYDDGIRSIITARCGGGTCHGTGSSRGDFTTYAGMLPNINNGNFEREVLTDQTMPRGGNLTQEEIDKIQCWVENGYPEN